MRGITRRVFLKAAALIGATLAIRRYIGSRKLSLTELFGPGEAGSAEGEKDVTIVSDVDAHSQCSMRVKVKGGRVIEVRGDPAGPESKGELTLRGKHTREILYAPDRLRYPMKRAGEKGGSKWKRISWDEALTTIANRLNEIKNRYGPEAIDFHHGHYHSGDV
jgi:anaerobic selenocysteine-containing dehydrogenase